jgi:hypothetical protein
MRLATLSLLLTLTLPLTAALVPGSEKPVTAPLLDVAALDVAAYDQSDARIATDGNSFLTIWIDHSLIGTGDLLGMSVKADGTRAGDEPMRIAATPDSEQRPALAWGAGRYLAVWSTPLGLRARFIGNDSALSATIEIEALPNGGTQPYLAFNGHVFLVVWSNGFGATFRGAVIDGNGTVLKRFDVASTDKTLSDSALAAAGGAFQFITAISDFGGAPNGNGYPADVGMTRIAEDGTVGPRVVVAPASTPAFTLSAASRNDEIAIGWTTALAIPGALVRTVRVTPSGAGAVESIPADGLVLNDVAADASGFLVLYGDHQHRYLRRLDSASSITLAVPALESELLDAASNGARTVAIVRGLPRLGFEYGPAGGDLYLMRLDTHDFQPLVVAPRHQMYPDLAAATDLRLAVWCEYLGNERRLGILAARLDPNGQTLDPAGIDLGADVYHPAPARVASNGTDWLVTWVDDVTVYGARVSHAGVRLDAAPLVIATGVLTGSAVAVSWDGTQYVVVYQRGQFLRGLRATIRAARISPAGVIAPELTLSSEAANELPAIASGANGSLVIWRSGVFLQGALLSRAGTSSPVTFPAASPVGYRPTVAWNGGTFLVAAPVTGSFGTEVQWVLASESGNVSVPQTSFVDIDSTITNDTYGFPSVELEPFGDSFLLSWNGVGHGLERRASVYAAGITRDGQLADPPVAIGITVADLWSTLGATGATVVYARPLGHPVREVTRVVARTMQLVPGNPRRRAVH